MKILLSLVCAGILLTSVSSLVSSSNRPANSFFAGTVDSFDPNVNGQINDVARQPDGKIIIGGTFSSVGGVTRYSVARINADGTLDQSFDANLTFTTFVLVYSVELLPNGQVLVGGYFNNFSSGPRHLVKLNSDGTRDLTFNSQIVSSTSGVLDMVSLPNGGILIGGFTFNFASFSRSGIAVLNADGSPSSAGPIFGNAASVRKIAAMSDGKIVLGGFIDGKVAWRLNSDLNVDGTFNGASADAWSLGVQTDGKILIGGPFLTVVSGGVTYTRNHIARLNADGTLDTAFDPGTNGDVYSIVQVSDGTIFIGGYFSLVGNGGTGTARTNIARLWEDGTVETLFDAGANSISYAIQIQPDLKPLFAGSFSTLGGVARNAIGRFEYLDPTSSPTPTPSATPVPTATPTPAPTPVLYVRGSVRDYSTRHRKPLNRATVTLSDGRIFITGSDGTYRFPVGQGCYSVSASLRSYLFIGNPDPPNVCVTNFDGVVDFLGYRP